MDKRIPQIDIIKGIAIISVVLIHSFNVNQLKQYFSLFHIGQAVPIFVLLLGLNTGRSFRDKGYASLRELYTLSYFKTRLRRLGVPFLFIALISVIIAYWAKVLVITPQMFLGRFAISGPGDYFVFLMLQFVLVFPLMYYAYLKRPVATVISCFVLDFATQLAIYAYQSYTHTIITAQYSYQIHTHTLMVAPNWLYQAFIVRYLSAVALGLWLSDDYDFFSRRNRFILYLLPLSIINLGLYQLYAQEGLTTFNSTFNGQNIFTFFYTAVLVMFCIKYLPATGITYPLSRLGQASWHIMLVQAFYFSIMPDAYNTGHRTLLNILISLLLGVLFFLFDTSETSVLLRKSTA